VTERASLMILQANAVALVFSRFAQYGSRRNQRFRILRPWLSQLMSSIKTRCSSRCSRFQISIPARRIAGWTRYDGAGKETFHARYSGPTSPDSTVTQAQWMQYDPDETLSSGFFSEGTRLRCIPTTTYTY